MNKKRFFLVMVVMIIAVVSVFGQNIAKEIKFEPKDVAENPTMEMDEKGEFINTSKVGVFNTDRFSLDMGKLESYKKFFEFSNVVVKTGLPNKAIVFGNMMDDKNAVIMLDQSMVKMEYKNSFEVQFINIPVHVMKIQLVVLEEKNYRVFTFTKIVKDDGKKQGSSSGGTSGDGGVSIPLFRP